MTFSSLWANQFDAQRFSPFFQASSNWLTLFLQWKPTSVNQPQQTPRNNPLRNWNSALNDCCPKSQNWRNQYRRWRCLVRTVWRPFSDVVAWVHPNMVIWDRIISTTMGLERREVVRITKVGSIRCSRLGPSLLDQVRIKENVSLINTTLKDLFYKSHLNPMLVVKRNIFKCALICK